MSSEAVAEDLPKIAPLRMNGAVERAPEPPEEGAAATVTPEVEVEDGCLTPKSEGHVMKPALVCPAAPRKPRPAPKRKMGHPPQGFFAVPRDLTLVFVPVSNHLRKKRIRAG